MNIKLFLCALFGHDWGMCGLYHVSGCADTSVAGDCSCHKYTYDCLRCGLSRWVSLDEFIAWF